MSTKTELLNRITVLTRRHNDAKTEAQVTDDRRLRKSYLRESKWASRECISLISHATGEGVGQADILNAVNSGVREADTLRRILLGDTSE